MRYAFGRQPHDPARLAALASHRMGASGPAPAAYAPVLTTPTLGHNDVAPDCVVVALANSARAWALTHGFDLPMPDQALYDLYGAVCPCAADLAAIEATNGLVMLDAMQRVERYGFANGCIAPIGAEVRAIDPDDSVALRDAVFARGSALVGIDLFAADETEPFAWTGAPVGDLLGGHAVAIVGYNPAGWTLATWGMLVRCSRAWLSGRIRESYAPTWLLSIAP